MTDLNLSTNNRSRSRPAAKVKSVRPMMDDDDMYILLFVHLHYSINILFIALITVLGLVLLPRLNLSDPRQMMMIRMSCYLCLHYSNNILVIALISPVEMMR